MVFGPIEIQRANISDSPTSLSYSNKLATKKAFGPVSLARLEDEIRKISSFQGTGIDFINIVYIFNGMG